jgi:hypothetical protein
MSTSMAMSVTCSYREAAGLTISQEAMRERA